MFSKIKGKLGFNNTGDKQAENDVYEVSATSADWLAQDQANRDVRDVAGTPKKKQSFDYSISTSRCGRWWD